MATNALSRKSRENLTLSKYDAKSIEIDLQGNASHYSIV